MSLTLRFFIIFLFCIQSFPAMAWNFLSVPKDVFSLDSANGWKPIKYGSQSEEFLGLKTSGQNIKFETNDFRIELFGVNELRFQEHEFSFQSGSLRIHFLNPKVSRRWVIKTDLAAAFVKGDDFLVNYDRGNAKFEVFALAGDAILRGEGRDEESYVRAGEVGSFKGVPELDGPAFDVMLKGKKVVRGSLVEARKISLLEGEGIEQKYVLETFVPPKPKVVKAKPGEICSAPFAKLNQCAWMCENNPKKEKSCRLDLQTVSCVRRRCNANGVWREDERVPSKFEEARCKTTQPIVGACDY